MTGRELPPSSPFAGDDGSADPALTATLTRYADGGAELADVVAALAPTRVLVPVLTVLSFAPDVALLVLGFIPGTTAVGVVALMLMHLVVVAAAVIAGRRIAPAR